jgi:DNA-directed RNA polymerase specialized sigma54-like protein
VRRPAAKLSHEDAVEIRDLCEIHLQTDVAKLFRVHESTISKVRRGLSWRVNGPVMPMPNFTNAKLTMAAVEDIRRLEGHLRIVDLAQMFGIHRSTVHRIISRRTWRDPE